MTDEIFAINKIKRSLSNTIHTSDAFVLHDILHRHPLKTVCVRPISMTANVNETNERHLYTVRNVACARFQPPSSEEYPEQAFPEKHAIVP